MEKRQNTISRLRKNIAQKAKDWLTEHVPEYLSQEADWIKLSPEIFIHERQYHRWAEKQLEQNIDKPVIERNDKIKFIRIDIEHAIEENPKLVILGDPGLGKSTTLHCITLQYVEDENKPLPIYLKLKLYDKYFGLLGLIHSSLKIDPEKLKDLQLIFLLDGFNEIGPDDQKSVLSNIFHLQADYLESRWIITSRKVEYPYGLENWSTCELLQFDNSRIQEYLDRVLGNKHSKVVWNRIQKQNLLDIARIPLLLSGICLLQQNDHALPETKGELLNNIVRYKFLKDEFFKKKFLAQIAPDIQNITLEECLNLISFLAHRVLVETTNITFDENFLLKTLASNILQQQALHIVKLFENLKLIEKHEIKYKDKRIRTVYSFWHQTFFEYFVGYHLQEIFSHVPKDKLLQKALPYFEFYKWDESVKIYLGLCDDKKSAEDFFSLALDQDIFLAVNYLSALENRLSPKIKLSFVEQLNERLTDWHFGGRISLIKIIGETGSSSLTLCLIPLLKRKDITVQTSAAEALGLMRDPKAVDHLIPLLKDKDDWMRWSAADALGLMRDPKAVDHLIPLLKDKDNWMRRSAAKALGLIRDPKAVDHLIPLLKDKNDLVRWSTADALGLIRDPKAVDHLIPLLKDKNDLVRWSAAEALSLMRDPKAVDHLIPLLKDKAKQVRRSAAKALGLIGDPKAVDHLIPLLKDKAKQVRRSAAKALGFMGDTKAVDHLIPLLKDKDDWVRRSTTEALGFVGDPKAVDHLIPLLKDKTKKVRLTAAEVLGFMGDTKAVDHLIPLLKDKTKRVCRSTVEALGLIGDPKAVDHLIPLLKDKSERMRWLAAEALSLIRDPKAVQLVINMLDGNDEMLDILSTESLSFICSNLTEKNWPPKVTAKVVDFKEKSVKNSESFRAFCDLCNFVKRRFIYIKSYDEDIKEKELKKEPKKGKILERTLEEGMKSYAMMWSPESPDGKEISKKEYMDLCKNISDYQIFIIDRGEYHEDSVGAVYFNGAPSSLQAEKNDISKNMETNDYEEKKFLASALTYRILVYTLKQQCKPGEIYNIVESCWSDPESAESIKENSKRLIERKFDKEKFYESTSTYRTGIAKASDFLWVNIGITLRTKRKRKYKLDPAPKYCVIDVNMEG